MISIRRAFPGDAEQLTLITIASKSYWNYSEKWMRLWLPLLAISPEYISENEVWMAADNEKIVAYYSLKYHEEFLWLDNLWVLPEHMRQGIGMQLFQHAVERSRASGGCILKIEADPNAQCFYEKMGARKISEHHGEVDGQPRILPVMEINL